MQTEEDEDDDDGDNEDESLSPVTERYQKVRDEEDHESCVNDIIAIYFRENSSRTSYYKVMASV